MIDSVSPATGRRLRDDLLMRWQRRVGLAPADGLGVRRRALAFAVIAWLPIALWAWSTGRAVDAGGESLLDHYQVGVRLLLAVPLMIVAESIALRTVLHLVPHCADVGLYRGEPSAVRAVGEGLVRLRDRVHPWVVALGAAAGLLAESVVRMRPMPIGPAAVLSVALPAALPMIALLATRIPLATIVKGIAGALL